MTHPSILILRPTAGLVIIEPAVLVLWIFSLLFFIATSFLLFYGLKGGLPSLLPSEKRGRRIVHIALGVAAALSSILIFVSGWHLFSTKSEEDLIEVLASGNNENYRYNAAHELAYKLDPVITHEVTARAESSDSARKGLEMMENHYIDVLAYGDQGQRENAIDCLAVINTRRSRDEIIWTLWNDRLPEVRGEAASALASNGDLSSIPSLVQAMIDERDPIVCEQIQVSLNGFPESALVKPLVDSRMTINDLEKRDRIDSFLALRIGPAAVDSLVAQLGPKENGWAEDILVQIGKPALSQVTQKAQTGSSESRWASLSVLLRIENPDSPLLPIVNDRDLREVANNYNEFIKLGLSGTEWILIDSLNNYGDIPMVDDFLNSANNSLDVAARNWVSQQPDLYIIEGTRHPGPKWGQAS